MRQQSRTVLNQQSTTGRADIANSLLADQQNKHSDSYQQGKQSTGDERNNPMPTIRALVRSSAFLHRSETQPEEKFVHSSPSSALLCGSMLTTTVNFPTRRAPSPQIRARDTSLDSAANGSARINSAPDVDAWINGTPHLGGQRRGDHEDRSDGANYRKLTEHNLRLPVWPPGRPHRRSA